MFQYRATMFVRMRGIAVMLLITAVFGGCVPPNQRDKPSRHLETGDFDIRAVRTWATDSLVPPERRKRAENALRKLENDTCDPEPTLVHATLDDLGPGDSMGWLTLIVVDEQRDLLGVRITETHTDSNGVTTLIEETYDVFIGQLGVPSPGPDAVAVHYRTGRQRKDERLWRDCVKSVRERGCGAEGQGHVSRTERGREARYTEIPPVWMAIPQASTIRVSLSVYDRSGNESESVPVEWVPWLEMLSGKEVWGEGTKGVR